MFDYHNSTVIFLWILGFYFIPMIAGYFTGKKKLIELSKFSNIGQKLGDPLTIKIHKWSRKYKIQCAQTGKWFFLFLLIFLNNLILTAFITRILYGIIFILPLFLTAWTGFGHGMVFSKKRGKIAIPITLIEFGGYLFASVIGVGLGLSIFDLVINSEPFVYTISWIYVILTIVFLLVGASIETISFKAASQNMDLSDLNSKDMDKRRKEITEHLD